MSALQLESLCKAYGDTVVLDSIDLDLAAGEFCTVVGASGCGKSTLLKLLLVAGACSDDGSDDASESADTTTTSAEGSTTGSEAV